MSRVVSHAESLGLWLMNKGLCTRTWARTHAQAQLSLKRDTHPILFSLSLSLRSPLGSFKKNLLFLWHPFFHLPLSFPLFFLFFPSQSPHISFVSVWVRKAVVQRDWLIITEYTKLGKRQKKNKTLCRLMSNMRETKITKRQNSIKRRESLHIPFSILCFCSLLFCFFNFFYFIASSVFAGGVLLPQFQFCLYKHLKLFLWLQEEINHFTKLQTTICLSLDVLPIFHLIYFLSCAWMLIIMLLLTAFLLCEVQINARSIVPPPTTTTRCVPVVI